MTDHRTAAQLDGGPRALSRLLNVAGTVVMGYLLWRDLLPHDPFSAWAWVWIGSGVALLGWLLREVVPVRTPVGLILLLVTIGVSSAVAIPTDVLGFVPGLVCLATLIANPERPLALGLGVALGVALVISVGAAVGHPQSGVLLGAASGFVIATLVGVSRRQYRAASTRERELLEERLRLEQERGHTAALGERSRIARDIHDVLAHSLGGLVLQLDAIDALLDAGRVEDAHRRVTAARGLAGSGLDEARRAVDALRDPETSADPGGAIEDLVVTHRSLGAEASLRVDGTPRELPPDTADALRRAAQEALSNARRHAPGQPTALELRWSADEVALSATTPLAADAAPSQLGGGHGLSGLRERMEEFGGSAQWTVADGAFVVTARIPLTAALAEGRPS